MIFLSIFDVLVIIIGISSVVYQGVCAVASLFAKPIVFPDAPMDKHYAVLISARNEEAVIGNLIHCIRTQTYDENLIDIWLVADNCTDSTAKVGRDAGCNVIERFDKEHIGKGFALSYLLDHIMKIGADKVYDAYFVFDADNKLDLSLIHI